MGGDGGATRQQRNEWKDSCTFGHGIVPQGMLLGVLFYQRAWECVTVCG